MTPFAGVVVLDDAPLGVEAEQRIGRALARDDRGRIQARRIGSACFARQISITGNENTGRPTLASRNERCLFAADARLDNRAELAATLGISPTELAQTSDGALILGMYERWGEAGVARCLGAFAFALWDPDARRLILGRDCIGYRVVFFHVGHDFVAFATTLGTLLAIPGVPRELDETALADFLAVKLDDRQHTFYRHIERTPTRCLVSIERNRITHREYWSPPLDVPPPYRREQDYVERARELFDQAVAAAITDTPDVAISTSGGLDSSAITATAARLGHSKSITCYTVVPPDDAQIDVGATKYLDERAKVEALAHMHPSINVRFFASDQAHVLDDDMARFFVRTNMPVLGPSTLSATAPLYDAVAAAGHRALLIGSSGNFGLSWRGDLSLLALLRSGHWTTFAQEFRAAAQSRDGVRRTFTRDVAVPAAPPWLRRVIHRVRGRDPFGVARYCALNPTYIAESGLRHQWRAQDFDAWPRAVGWNAARYRARYLFDLNHVGRDLRAMSQTSFGFEWRDPHSDRRLLEFALSVPEPLYRRNGVPRSFARAVFADRLPPEILNERRRGANAATWFRRLDSRRQDIAAEIERLEASTLARRLIDLPRLRRLLKEWPENENAAELRTPDYRAALSRGIHVGRFIRWVEGGNS